MKELCYYFRDKEKKPVVTVVLIIDDNHNVARGIAICSDLETPVTTSSAQRRNGPGLARKRAMKALKQQKNLFTIRREEPVRILKGAKAAALLVACDGFKATYNGYPTTYEEKLLEKAVAQKGGQNENGKSDD